MFQEGKQEMPCSCIKPEFSLIYKDRHDSNRILQITFFMSSKLQILESLEPEPLFFQSGAGADTSGPEPESALGPLAFGAGDAQKSGGSATPSTSIN